MLEEEPFEPAFTEDQLKAYAFDRLDDPDLLRKMDEEFLGNPEGEVAQYLRRIEVMNSQALNPDLRRLFQERR